MFSERKYRTNNFYQHFILNVSIHSALHQKRKTTPIDWTAHLATSTKTKSKLKTQISRFPSISQRAAESLLGAEPT